MSPSDALRDGRRQVWHRGRLLGRALPLPEVVDGPRHRGVQVDPGVDDGGHHSVGNVQGGKFSQHLSDTRKVYIKLSYRTVVKHIEVEIIYCEKSQDSNIDNH